MDAVEDYLESCAQIKVDIEVVERLLRPENLEVSLRYVSKHATEEAATFSRSSTHQKSRTTSWQAEDDGWKVREETVHGRRMGMSGDLEYQGARAKAPPCPDSTLQTPLPQQSSSSAREEEDDWVLMEDRRRRRIAFENKAKEMLRYLDNSDDVKVGITELQERLEVPVQIGISIQQVAPAGEK